MPKEVDFLHRMIYHELEEIVGIENITTKSVDKDVYPLDVYILPRLWLERGCELPKPDYIVFPESTEQISQIVSLANTYKIPVIPRGGGAGDAGGVLPIYGGIMVDMKKMDKIVSIDEKSLTVTAQTGILQIDLEQPLNDKGYTLNHLPASIYCSSLGGFLVDRGSGVLSTKYGKIDDMVLSLQIVLPTGEIIRTLPVPQHSSGPELNRLFLGSEGTFGIITEATLKIHFLPEERRFRAFVFNDLHSAIETGRKIMTSRLHPCLIRIYDEADTRVWVKSVLGFDREKAAYMIIGFDGFKEVVDAEEKLAADICLEEKAEDLGEEPAKHWWNHRYDFYLPPHTLESSPPYLYGVIDTVATYENIERVYNAMKQAIEETYKEWEVTFVAHFSHWYEWGTIIYPNFIIKNPPKDPHEALRLNNRIWATGVRAALKNGGVVNEHHGIGLKLGKFLKEQYGVGFKVLENIKKALDPNNIMNPGKLGFEGR